MSDRRIKWAAQLGNVRDVSVRGWADLQYWSEYLEPYGLKPADHDGKAEIVILGGSGRFRGVAFRELSIVVILSAEHSVNQQDAAFLIQSFNSCRFFAFCERVFFSTPHNHASVSLIHSLPASMSVKLATNDLLRISMGSSKSNMREPTFSGNENWDIAVYLPYDHARKRNTGKMFFSRVQGYASKYSFDVTDDTLFLHLYENVDVEAQLVVADLLESEFSPYVWILRDSAMHAKSKTYSASSFA